jgi:N-acetylmuramoyl-L-alanine amidase
VDGPLLPVAVGDEGDTVARIQRLLRSRSLYDGVIDGSFGPGTCAGVEAFQTSIGVEPSGVVDPETWTSLADLGHPLFDPDRRDDERLLYLQWPVLEGADVEELQQRLSVLGFHRSRIDGIFGPETESSVGAFQRNTGLIEDRVCGPETRELLVDLTSRDPSGRSLAEVWESEFLLLVPNDDLEYGIGVSAGDDAEPLGRSVHRQLVDTGGRIRLVAGEPAAQIQVCNDLALEVFIHVTCSDSAEVRYYETSGGFVSVAGRQLAEALAAGVNRIAGDGPPVQTTGGSGIRLRGTRCPAVELSLTRSQVVAIPAHELAELISSVLRTWRTTHRSSEPSTSA